jgi:hypothetical protein
VAELGPDLRRGLRSRDGRRLGSVCELRSMLRTNEDNTKIDSPYPCSTTNIQGPIDVFDGSKIQSLVQAEPHYVVLEVCNGSVMPFTCKETDVPKRSLSSYNMQ